MEVEALSKQVEQLRGRIQILEDEQAIQKLETAYAYFIEHLMVDEIADCWADDGAMVWVGLGIFRGKHAINKLWQTVKEHFVARGESRHLGPRISPYVTVAPEGKTANARWYVAGTPLGASMLCENTYIKEDGVWKIDVMNVGAFPLDPITLASIAASSALGPDAALAASKAEPAPMTPEEEEKQTQEYMSVYPFSERLRRTPRQEYGPYLRPFSFRHPVTGRDLNETVAAHNAANPCPMPPGGEKWTARDQA